MHVPSAVTLLFFVVQSLSHIHYSVTPQNAAHQASLSFTISWSLLKFMSIESVMPSDHLTLCRPPPPLALNLSHPKAAWERLKAVQSFPILLLLLLSHFSRVPLCATPCIAARQASLSITNSRSSLKLLSIESVMPSSHLILCRPLLLLPPTPPSIRVFSNESTLLMRWPKY